MELKRAGRGHHAVKCPGLTSRDANRLLCRNISPSPEDLLLSVTQSTDILNHLSSAFPPFCIISSFSARIYTHLVRTDASGFTVAPLRGCVNVSIIARNTLIFRIFLVPTMHLFCSQFHNAWPFIVLVLATIREVLIWRQLWFLPLLQKNFCLIRTFCANRYKFKTQSDAEWTFYTFSFSLFIPAFIPLDLFSHMDFNVANMYELINRGQSMQFIHFVVNFNTLRLLLSLCYF